MKSFDGLCCVVVIVCNCRWWSAAAAAMEMRRFCLLFSPKTGTIILGCLGIVFFVFYSILQSMILKNHEFHVKQFVLEQRLETGKEDCRITPKYLHTFLSACLPTAKIELSNLCDVLFPILAQSHTKEAGCATCHEQGARHTKHIIFYSFYR